MEQTFKELSKIITLKPDEIQTYSYQFQGQPQEHLEKFMVAYARKQELQNQKDILNKFINYMAEQRHCKLMGNFFNETEGIKILSCSECKSYSFDHQSRAYCLYGRAVSGLKRKAKEAETERSFMTNQIENTIFQMLQDGNYPLSKFQSREIDDVLLNFSNEDPQFDPIFLSNQVFSPFIPQPYALVLVLPLPLPKSDHLLNFLKSSLLHIHMDDLHLLNKLISKENFYKNSAIKGIYFIDQGEVESTGGRVVARGWVTHGKCKSEGFGWKFKVLPFLKSFLKNEHIWKQFVNDLTLNKEYPLKVSNALGLDQDMNMYEMPDKRGRRGLKLPRIGNSSLDYSKLTEIQKMKHYDERINDICDYKEKLLQKKENNSTKKTQRLVDSYDQRAHRKMMKQPSNSRPMLRYPSSSLTSSSENILIMSVLKKLESLAEPKNPFNDEYMRQKKEKIKISPAQLFEKSRVMKKKRYNS